MEANFFSNFPSVSFTKAELAYAIFILMDDIPITNNSTKMELLELRHYLNQIKEYVALSTHDGTLIKAAKTALQGFGEQIPYNEPTEPEKPLLPSLTALKSQFPTLTEDEIQEIISKNREEQEKEVKEKESKMPPPLPKGLIKKPFAHLVDKRLDPVEQIVSTPEKQEESNTKKFATMLGL